MYSWIFGSSPKMIIPLILCSNLPRFQMADKRLSLFSIRFIAWRIKICHRQLFIYAVPRKRGAKATPTGGPERSEWVSVAHNPKCWKHLYVVILVKTGIQNAGTRRIIRTSHSWISGSSPQMTRGCIRMYTKW